MNLRVRLGFVLLLALLLAVPQSWATHKEDPRGDQTAQEPYDGFKDSGFTCQDEAMDLTATWASIHSTTVYLGVSVPDMNATGAECGIPYVPLQRVGYLNGTFNATATSGHLVSIVFGARGDTACVRVTDVASGASGCISSSRYFVGPFFEWGFARSGTFTDGSGTSHAYALDGPVAYEVETWSVGGSLGDVRLPTLYDWAAY